MVIPAAHTGGGGSGASGRNGSGGGRPGGAGGSGVVILSVPTSGYSGVYTGTCVVVTTCGSNTRIQFNSGGTYKS